MTAYDNGMSAVRTPWAVICRPCAQVVYLTNRGYIHQLWDAHSKWVCPNCWNDAEFDDVNYQDAMEQAHEQAKGEIDQ